MTTQTLTDRITKLQPRLRYLALSMTGGDEYRADDLLQNAMVRVIATCSPDTEDNIVYLRSKSAMLHSVRAEQTYNRIMADESQLAGPSEDDETLGLVFESYRAEGQNSPEDEVIQRQELAGIFAAVSQLSPENRQIIQMLYSGYNASEIARDLGVSRAAVSQRMNRITDKLVSFGLQPA